jgi:hypothetical protein
VATVELYSSWDAIFNAATAGILAAFGLWVWTLRPRSRVSSLLALFAVAHGVQYVVVNLWAVPATTAALRLSAGKDLAFNTICAIALLGVAREVLLSNGTAGRKIWRWTWPLALATGIVTWVLAGVSAGLGVKLSNIDFFAVAALSYHHLVVAFASLPLAFAVMYRYADGPERRRLMLTLSIAFLLWPAIFATFAIYQLVSESTPLWQHLAGAIATVATGILWLSNIPVATETSRLARNAGLTVFALLLFGALDAAFLSDLLDYHPSAGGPFFGLARLASVVILAHAILHQQVLGMDAKLRFALSKSTLAAIFIAVFFVASEAAQQYFGDTLGSTYVGIAVAGALVFVMAPLQRMAERFATKALPMSEGSGIATPLRAEAAYRAALRAAARDGVITRREELHLAEIAENLGIGHRRAVEIRSEVEAE